MPCNRKQLSSCWESNELTFLSKQRVKGNLQAEFILRPLIELKIKGSGLTTRIKTYLRLQGSTNLIQLITFKNRFWSLKITRLPHLI
jgi:hypothetical protein